jgi:serine/threonine-protein kinase
VSTPAQHIAPAGGEAIERPVQAAAPAGGEQPALAKEKSTWLQRGTLVGYYEVVDQIGEGGFGTLYKVKRGESFYALKMAKHRSLEAPATEQMPARNSDQDRADREAAALLSLRHPNIVKVHAFDRWPDLSGGYPYLVMDLVEGDRLVDWARRYAPSLRAIATVFKKIALALAEMHRLELYHRDLKSANVLVRKAGPGGEAAEPVILDFGIARPRSTFTVTRNAEMVGTFTHLAPEYCRWFFCGASVKGVRFVYTAECDLHAVGVMLYEVLTGLEPYGGGGEDLDPEAHRFATMRVIAEDLPAHPRTWNDAVPASLDAVAMQLLAKEPEDRYPGGVELAAALDGILAEAGPAWDVPFEVPIPVACPAEERRAKGTRSGRKKRQRGEKDGPVIAAARELPAVAVAREAAKPAGDARQPVEAAAALPEPVADEQILANEPAKGKAERAGPAPRIDLPDAEEAPVFVEPVKGPSAPEERRAASPPPPPMPTAVLDAQRQVEVATRAAKRGRMRWLIPAGVGVAMVLVILALAASEKRPVKPESLIESAKRLEARATPPAPAGPSEAAMSSASLPPPPQAAAAPSRSAEPPPVVQRNLPASPAGPAQARSGRRSDAAQIDVMLREAWASPAMAGMAEPPESGPELVPLPTARGSVKPPAAVPMKAPPPRSQPSWLKRSEDIESPGKVAAARGPLGIPTGAHLPVELLTNLDSRTAGSGPVEVILRRPVLLGGAVALPSRTMVYGDAIVSGDRFSIRFTRLRLPDNREIQFEGLAFDRAEKKPGLSPGRRIATERATEGVVSRVVKGAARDLVSKVSGDTAHDVARGAGQTALNGDEQAANSGEALLIDAGLVFDVFVQRAF